MLEFIETQITAGLTIYVRTARGAIKVSPKTVAKFNTGGHKLFKTDSEGNLRIASGKSFNIICTPHIALVGVTASAN